MVGGPGRNTGILPFHEKNRRGDACSETCSGLGSLSYLYDCRNNSGIDGSFVGNTPLIRLRAHLSLNTPREAEIFGKKRKFISRGSVKKSRRHRNHPLTLRSGVRLNRGRNHSLMELLVTLGSGFVVIDGLGVWHRYL